MKPTTKPNARQDPRAITAGLVAVPLVWAGMVVGVSFLATTAKFLAPGLDLSVALDIGRHTFQTFNRVEIGFGVLLLVLAFWRAPTHWPRVLAVALPCGIVAMETGWLLPALAARVDLITAGGSPPPSNLHVFYILLETMKLIALLALGLTFLLRSGTTGREVAGTRSAQYRPVQPHDAPSTVENRARILHLDKRRRRQ